MVRKIKDTSPETQEPRPAPLGRAPVQFVLVVVVVQLLWRRAFSIFVDVARRPAHFLWCVSSVSRVVRVASAAFARRQSCSKSRLCCLALHSDAFATRRLFAATIWQLWRPERSVRATFAAGATSNSFAFRPDAKLSGARQPPAAPELSVRPARRWKSVCHIFCSCELVQRHTRTPRLFARSPATGLLPARHLLAARTCEKPDIAALRAAGRGAGRIEPSAEG